MHGMFIIIKCNIESSRCDREYRIDTEACPLRNTGWAKKQRHSAFSH